MNRSAQKLREGFVEYFLLSCGLLSIVLTVAIAVTVVTGAGRFFTLKDAAHTPAAAGGPAGHAAAKGGLEPMTGEEIRARVQEFCFAREWTAGFQQPVYGIQSLLLGTLLVAVIAALFALPIGVTTAIYLSEYAHPKVRSFAKPTLELLAGIPTVVYGFFALTVITPGLAYLFADNLAAMEVGGFVGFLRDIGVLPLFPGRLSDPNNQIAGGLVVGIMIIPMVASLSEDALRAVPRALRDGAIALGANKFETSTKVVFPAALSGITASFILAISRAIGETMAVSLACGNTPHYTLDPRQGLATMTSFIVRISMGDVQVDSTDYNSLYAVAGVLFFMTLTMNIFAQVFLKKYRQVYQ